MAEQDVAGTFKGKCANTVRPVLEAFASVGLAGRLNERWLGKFGQAVKWSFCLKVASMAAE
ncbi:hypothetical protein, partial [Sphingomonas sp. 10B4]